MPVGDKYTPVYGEIAKLPGGEEIVYAQKSLREYLHNVEIPEKAFESVSDFKKYGTAISNEIRIVLDDIIRLAVDRSLMFGIKRNIESLKESGVNLTDIDATRISKRYSYKAEFEGKPLSTRLYQLERTTHEALKNIAGRVNLEQNVKLKAARDYITGEILGRNTFRPAAIITVSESRRAIQESGALVAEYLEEEGINAYCIWHLSILPNRKKDVCDDYAQTGIFRSKDVPRYPHSSCGCWVETVTNGDLSGSGKYNYMASALSLLLSGQQRVTTTEQMLDAHEEDLNQYIEEHENN